jgi:hypothetical protein
LNADHAGVPLMGHHPRISRNGRIVGTVFASFWSATVVLNYLGDSVAAV